VSSRHSIGNRSGTCAGDCLAEVVSPAYDECNCAPCASQAVTMHCRTASALQLQAIARSRSCPQQSTLGRLCKRARLQLELPSKLVQLRLQSLHSDGLCRCAPV
jgi:hypothetical protein